MRKTTLLKISVAALLAVGATQPWEAVRAGFEGSGPDVSVENAAGEPAAAAEVDDPGDAVSAAPKKKGNGFANALKAPFRAIGRLFGGGKDDGRPRRLTERDVERFESAKAVRIRDASTAAAPAVIPAGTADELVSQGRSLLNGGRAAEAIDLLSRAVAIDPRAAEAHHLLGVAYGLKGFTQFAVAAYEHALSIAPNDARTLNDYGYLLYQHGDYRTAAKHLKRAAKYAPSDERVWNNLALAQCRLEKFDDAYKSFARAAGEFKGRLNVGAVLARLGRNEEAIKHYEAARRLDPISPVVLQQLASLYERTGQSQKAEAVRHAFTAAAGGVGGSN